MIANPMFRRLVWLAVRELASNPALRRDLADGYRRARPHAARAYRSARPHMANALARLATALRAPRPRRRVTLSPFRFVRSRMFRLRL
jgi:hypothetical protein